MVEIATFGKEYGWLTAVLVWLIYQGVTRMWPQWFNARTKAATAEREANRAERSERSVEAHSEQAAAFAVYEKFIVAQVESTKAQIETTKYIAQCTACLQNVERAIDQNTLEVRRLGGCVAELTDKMSVKE
jgi:23S rRNA G2069 N7-methylase RlmK/C1962 C5-methylase RlmI